MKKMKLRKLIFALTTINIIITLISVFSNYIIRIFLSYKLNSEAARAGTIGIIGGADGPTAIFISSNPSPYIITVISALLSIAGIIYLVFSRRAGE
ncbi:MAG TPA: hypothetical protein GXX20_05200 [Clostridiaceae bacterium]|nr:hypothetical protein [Clostridiaceae bacterium]